jgi:hypothetical protein
VKDLDDNAGVSDLTFWQKRHVVLPTMPWCAIAVAIADFGLRIADSFPGRYSPRQSAIRNPQSAIRNKAL